MNKKSRQEAQIGTQAHLAVDKYYGQFEIVTFNVTPVSPTENIQVREEFNDTGRAKFYKKLAKENPQAFLDVGFQYNDVQIIAEDGLEGGDVRRPEMLKYFNVDHILAIRWGGKNNYENLCFMRATLNKLKGSWEEIQARKVKEWPMKLQTVVPTKTDGEYRSYVTQKSRQSNQRPPKVKTQGCVAAY